MNTCMTIAAQQLRRAYRHCTRALLPLVGISLIGTGALGQTFNSATAPETTFPTPAAAPAYFLDGDIHYLFSSSIYTALLYAPPYYSGTSTIASWSHKMYVDPSGVSMTDGGGFAIGLIEPAGSYVGEVLTAMPNAANISAVVLHGACQENVMVVYAVPCSEVEAECVPYAKYYYQLYHWTHPSTLAPIGGPVALTSSCSYFDCISIDINHDATKAVVVWGHNNTAVFAKAFDFSGGTLGIGPTTLITDKGNLADVAFRKDPLAGTEYVHMAYLSRVLRASCPSYYVENEDLGLSDATFIEGQTTFADLFGGTYTGLSSLNIEPSGVSGLVDEYNLVLDAPDESTDPNWSYTWNRNGGSRVYVRTYKDMLSGPTDPSWTANDGILAPGGLPAYTAAHTPTLAYHPSGDRYFTGFAGGPNHYIATEVSDAGGLLSGVDYLNIPNNNYSPGTNPRVSFSKNSSGDYLYTVFGQTDAAGNYSLVHKGHPWSGMFSWNKEITPVSQPITVYPNPFKEHLELHIPVSMRDRNWTATLSDVLGRYPIQLSGDADQLNHQLQQEAVLLSPGSYFMMLQDNMGTHENFKLIKE